MKALILAAGRGKRMRPLTDELPKPLLVGAGKRLIEWQIEGLVRAGVTEIVINTAHLSHTFEPILGHEHLGAKIVYSKEGETHDDSLETLGGIVKALPHLTDGTEPFIVVAGDIVTDFDYRRLVAQSEAIISGEKVAHLVLVDNPDFHREGDMGMVEGKVTREARDFTFSSLGVYSPKIFEGQPIVFSKLFPWLYQFCEAGLVTGEYFNGRWDNVGTPEALSQLQPLQ